jgi:hypothetical protein
MATLAALALLAVSGGKHAVELRQVNSRLWHQGGQPGDEVERLEDDVHQAMRKALVPFAKQAFVVRCLQPGRWLAGFCSVNTLRGVPGINR